MSAPRLQFLFLSYVFATISVLSPFRFPLIQTGNIGYDFHLGPDMGAPEWQELAGNYDAARDKWKHLLTEYGFTIESPEHCSARGKCPIDFKFSPKTDSAVSVKVCAFGCVVCVVLYMHFSLCVYDASV